MSNEFKVTFLGGLNKIGRNCMVLEHAKSMVVVDCGILFPEVDMLGIDYILPDLNYLYDNKDKVDGIVITHAHEDHAGALQFLLREVDAPIYSSPLSLKLLSRRLDEAGMLGSTRVMPVKDGETHQIGKFSAEFIPVTHSVPFAFATAYTCKAGTIFHTGDFKIDHSPVDGRRTDLQRIGEIAATKGIDLLLSDSTGAERPGTTPSETSIKLTSERIFSENKDKRIIISTFASHIHRIEQVMDSAIASGRKISFLGRSLQNNITSATELGMMNINEKNFVPIEEIDKYAKDQVCVIATGSQGEPLAALSLIASGQSKFLSVDENDCVVFSSHTIPGNETAVNRLINAFMRRGTKVIHDGNAPIHVSGHASADELATMINICTPRYFVPVHGEHRHLKAHADIALDCGMEPDNVFVCHDGDQITVKKTSAQVQEDAVSSSYLYVDGNVGGITNALLRDRRAIGADGLVVVVVTIDYQEGEIQGDVEVVTRGWVPRADVEEYIKTTQDEIRKDVETALASGERDVEALKTIVRRSAGNATSDTTGRRPTILPLVLEV